MDIVRKIFIPFTILVLSAWYFPVNSQVSSYLGRFEADFDRGCNPFTVILTEIDTFPPTTVIQYDFTNNGTFVGFEDGEEISFTYNAPGNYSIIQLTGIDITGVSKLDTLDITVFPSISPDYTIFTCENNGAKVEILPDSYDQHKIFYTPTDSIIVDAGEEVPSFVYPAGNHSVTVIGLYIGGKENCASSTKSFNTIQNLLPADFNRVQMIEKNSISGAVELGYQLPPHVIYELQKAENLPSGFQALQFLNNSSSSITIDSINTEDDLQIFRISAYDACQEKYLYSDTISTITIQVTAENSQNRIEWNSYPLSFSNYQLNRNNQLLQNFNNSGLKIYYDHDVACFNTYCYTIQYSNTKGGISISDTVCVESFKIYFPPSIKNTTVSVNGSNVDLTWDDPDNVIITSYFVQRQVEDDIFATIDSTMQRQYTDIDLNTETRSYCYSINYLDECRNRSNQGDLACSLFLTIEDNQLLEWNGYIGWRNGVMQYIVEVYDELGMLEQEINVGLNKWYEDTTFLTQQINEYRIRAESNDTPALTAYSNFVIKQIESVLWLPNSFTPNGDGLNDIFKPEGTQMKQFMMQIFTRYGDLIYTTDNQNLGWDGTFNGKDLRPVTYIYKIEATDELDKKYNRTGQLLLIRH